jgi:hypothetical protein
MSTDPVAEDLLPEYDFDHGKSRVNRFAGHDRAAVILDDEVFAYLKARADEKGRKHSDLVNDLLKREIDLVESVKSVSTEPIDPLSPAVSSGSQQQDPADEKTRHSNA